MNLRLNLPNSDCSGKAIHIFRNTNIQITTQRHLGVAVLCISQFRDQYVMEKMSKWVEELHEPQAAYTCNFEWL